jgi:hypothetical protein
MKRQSIREHINKVCAPATTLARSGFARDVAYELQRAYRIGLNNGKLIAAKRNAPSEFGNVFSTEENR